MDYRTLRDGTRISTLGIGSGNYGTNGVTSPLAERLFAMAFEAGVNFVDTCMPDELPLEGMARAILGRRQELVLQSHLCVAYPGGRYEKIEGDLARTRDAFARELKKYGTDYCDIGTLHYLDEDRDIPRMVESGIVDYVFRLKKEGIIRNVAFSSHTPSVARKMLDVADFDVMFFGVNAGYDYVPQEGGGLALSEERMDLYRECARRGIAITVMKPYSNGRLLDARLSPFGRAMNPFQCLQYALDRPAVVSCLVGAVTEEQMAQSLRFYESTPQERDYSFLGGLQQRDMAGNCTYCGHCHPCPAGINIAAVNKYYDLARVGDKLAAQHYLGLERRAEHCLRCGLCSDRCPFHSGPTARMEEIGSFFASLR